MMVTKEIEETVETVDYETVTDQVVWCDGCLDECTDDHVTLTNIGPECVEKIIADSGSVEGIEGVYIQRDAVESVLEGAEEFQFCPGCQRGIGAHERTISTELFETDEESNSDESESPHPTLKRAMFWIGLLFFVSAFAQTTVGQAFFMLFLALAMIATSKVSFHDADGRCIW